MIVNNFIFCFVRKIKLSEDKAENENLQHTQTAIVRTRKQSALQHKSATIAEAAI